MSERGDRYLHTRQQAKPPLRFYDHHRQRYADTVQIGHAGEFLIGDYNDDATVNDDGEFKVTLNELADGGHRALYPKLEVFGDGTRSLRRAIDAGLFDALDPLDAVDEFAARLLALGFVDRSDRPRRRVGHDPLCEGGSRAVSSASASPSQYNRLRIGTEGDVTPSMTSAPSTTAQTTEAGSA